MIKLGATVMVAQKYWGTVFFFMEPGMAMVRV